MELPARNTMLMLKLSLNIIAGIVGVGIFALPYAYAQAWPASIIVLIISGIIIVTLELLCVSIVYERGIGRSQLPGIVRVIFGKKTGTVIGMLLTIGRTGILFLYTIVLGEFSVLLARNLLGLDLRPELPAIIFTLLCALTISRQIRFVSKVNFWLTILKVGLLFFVSVLGIMLLRELRFPRLLDFAPLTTGGWILKIGTIYGVSIGALSGIAGIPALKELTRNREPLKWAVILSGIITVILYAVFSAFILVASPSVSQDALTGLGHAWWVTLLAGAGLVCIVTAYITAGNSLFEIYIHDYKFPQALAWSLTLIPPIALYLSGIRDLTAAVAILGGTIGGIEGITIIASYWKARQNSNQLKAHAKVMLAGLAMILAIGAVIVL